MKTEVHLVIDINEFRIKEHAINGFTIERLFQWEIYSRFLFWKYNKRKCSKWKQISDSGDEPFVYHLFGSVAHRQSTLKPFKTKQDAIGFLEKLCTPNKFYYPTDFK